MPPSGDSIESHLNSFEGRNRSASQGGPRRRRGARHRQPVRGRTDRDHGYRQRHRAHRYGHRRDRAIHPDRRSHQPRQFRRRTNR